MMNAWRQRKKHKSGEDSERNTHEQINFKKTETLKSKKKKNEESKKYFLKNWWRIG